MKLLPYILFEKYVNILALEMASPGNGHCANCIGTLSFSIASRIVLYFTSSFIYRYFITCLVVTPGCGLSTVIKVIFNLIFTGNKSVPIQLAQCRFRWLAISMLKYEYISQIKYTEVILSMGGSVA